MRQKIRANGRSYRGNRLFSVRLGGQLEADACEASQKTVGGLSGLIREGLALRLYGNRNPNRAARA